MSRELQNWEKALQTSKKKFNEINSINNFVDYDKEAMFCMQLIQKNDYLMGIANTNPESLRNAVINIAAIGLSLNPATKYAYLVPRDNSACLDISYIGLIKLATDTGAIMWARAELVHENDVFIYHGATDKPEFSSPNPFDRGEIKGVYCVSKTREGDYLSGIMSIDEINDIKGRSAAGKKGYGPWFSDFGEMAKKTIIKRESKTWPQSVGSERLDNAIEVINQHEGIDFKSISDEPINHQLVEEVYMRVVEIITNDTDEEADYLEVQELYRSLTQDEQMQLNSKLQKYKPEGSRQYNTLLKDYLAYKPEAIEGLLE